MGSCPDTDIDPHLFNLDLTQEKRYSETLRIKRAFAVVNSYLIDRAVRKLGLIASLRRW